MNGDLLQSLTEISATAFLQVLLGLVIWKLAPRLVDKFTESISEQREASKLQLDQLTATFDKAIEEITQALEKLEEDNEKSGDQVERLINLYVSTVAGSDVKKHQVLTERILNGKEDKDES